MKKIIAGAAIAALSAGLVFADGPVANVSVTDFTGNASVEWGADLDAQKTGFKNSEYMKFVINLFDAGTKSTSSDNDIWAELVMKAGNTKSWTHRLYQYDATVDYTADGNAAGINDANLSFDIDTAKIHIGKLYVGIQNGDTLTGELDFNAAVRGKGMWKGQGRWLANVGDNHTQGIVAGYDDNNLGVAVDYRSKQDGTNRYTNDYAVAAEVTLKESNEWLNGLNVKAGGSYTLFDKKATSSSGKVIVTEDIAKTLGYSASASYKYKIDDKYYVRPTVGFTGVNVTQNVKAGDKTGTSTTNTNALAAGIILGWGAESSDADAGLYYFDTDACKGTVPGLSVIVGIPMATTSKNTLTDVETTSYITPKVLINPAFCTKGDLVEGLKAAAYSEIAILNGEASTDTKVVKGVAANKDETFAMAVAATIAYDLKSDNVTITPQAGFRYANNVYADNSVSNYFKHTGNDAAFFDGMGDQKPSTDAKKASGSVAGDFFNLKAGVNVNGLINNTDLYVVYQSANLLNQKEYTKDTGYHNGAYNVKNGTINVGCKISF